MTTNRYGYQDPAALFLDEELKTKQLLSKIQKLGVDTSYLEKRIQNISDSIEKEIGKKFEQYESNLNTFLKDGKLNNIYNKGINLLHDIQRYIIEGYLKENKIDKKVNYYLAVLNDEYEYDGTLVDGKRVYNPDKFGNTIIDFYDVNDITEMYQNRIDIERQNLERYIFDSDSSPCNLSVACALKKNTECKFKPICFKNVPSFSFKNF